MRWDPANMAWTVALQLQVPGFQRVGVRGPRPAPPRAPPRHPRPRGVTRSASRKRSYPGLSTPGPDTPCPCPCPCHTLMVHACNLPLWRVDRLIAFLVLLIAAWFHILGMIVPLGACKCGLMSLLIGFDIYGNLHRVGLGSKSYLNEQ